MTEDERKWHEDQRANGWKLPAPAPRWLRLPIIRRFRAMWLDRKVEQHYRSGISYFFGARSGYDEWVLYAISRGWC